MVAIHSWPGIQWDVETSPSPDVCVYTIRLKNADGTEQVLTKPCPFLSACKELGRTCAEFQERLGKPEQA